MIHVAVPVAAQIMPKPMQVYALISGRLRTTEITEDMTEPLREEPIAVTALVAVARSRKNCFGAALIKFVNGLVAPGISP